MSTEILLENLWGFAVNKKPYFFSMSYSFYLFLISDGFAVGVLNLVCGVGVFS